MRGEDDLDLVIDSALSTYAEPGDEAGLVGRVLARVAEERVADGRADRRGRRWMIWAIALPVAACLLLLVLWAPKAGHAPGSRASQRHPSGQAEQTAENGKGRGGPTERHSSGAKAPSDFEALLARLKSCPVTKPRFSVACKDSALTAQVRPDTIEAGSPALPKLDVFPTPHPLTSQEKALARVARKTPAPELEALAKADEGANLPVSIAAVHIPPLEPPDEGEN